MCPTKFKCYLLKCLLYRGYCISSSYKGMHLEFNNITDMLQSNGYPLHFIQNQINRFLDYEQKSEEHIHCLRVILKLSFIGDHSLDVEKNYNHFFIAFCCII